MIWYNIRQFHALNLPKCKEYLALKDKAIEANALFPDNISLDKARRSIKGHFWPDLIRRSGNTVSTRPIIGSKKLDWNIFEVILDSKKMYKHKKTNLPYIWPGGIITDSLKWDFCTCHKILQSIQIFFKSAKLSLTSKTTSNFWRI